MLPPKLSWYVRSTRTPRSWNSRTRLRCTIVAPTWDLMSSPTIGTPRRRKRSAQESLPAMKTGMQLTSAQPASSACSAYQRGRLLGAHG